MFCLGIHMRCIVIYVHLTINLLNQKVKQNKNKWPINIIIIINKKDWIKQSTGSQNIYILFLFIFIKKKLIYFYRLEFRFDTR